MNVNTVLGVDINRNWVLRNHDIVLTDGYETLYQAIENRLSCALDDLGYFYDDYGSKLYEFHGQHLKPQLMQEIANEVLLRLRQEPRLSDIEVSVRQGGINSVAIYITGIVDEDEEFEGNFLLDTVTKGITKLGYVPTQIKLHLGKWDCQHPISAKQVRKGEEIEIQCRVYNHKAQPIRVGNVDFYIGGLYRNVPVVNGKANLTFTFPPQWNNGEYTIKAHYNGLGKYMSSDAHLTVTLDDTWDTETYFRQENNYAIPYTRVMFPTYVDDSFGRGVTHGDLVYYINYTHRLGTRLDAENIYSLIPTKGRAVWSRATVYDEWDNYAKCGCINFYINDAVPFMKATQTILQNGYIEYGTNLTWLRSQTVDGDYDPVYTGKTDFYYRECPQILETETELVNDLTLISQGLDHEKQIEATVTDEDGIMVFNGDMDYYVRKCGRCKPYDTFTTTNDTTVRDGRTFTNSSVVDEDMIPVPRGDIAYSFDNLPISVSTYNTELFSTGARYGAMIIDENNNVIDTGEIMTQTLDDETVTNYVSSDNVDEDESIKLKLIGDKNK